MRKCFHFDHNKTHPSEFLLAITAFGNTARFLGVQVDKFTSRCLGTVGKSDYNTSDHMKWTERTFVGTRSDKCHILSTNPYLHLPLVGFGVIRQSSSIG